MGLTKTEKFTADQNGLAAIAKAIAHPARIAILQHLAQINSCVCGDLVEVLPLAQATVSQHLRELKAAGLIKGNIEGTSVCYCIDSENWSAAQAQLMAMFDAYVPTECCGPDDSASNESCNETNDNIRSYNFLDLNKIK